MKDILGKHFTLHSVDGEPIYIYRVVEKLDARKFLASTYVVETGRAMRKLTDPITLEDLIEHGYVEATQEEIEMVGDLI